LFFPNIKFNPEDGKTVNSSNDLRSDMDNCTTLKVKSAWA